jgi:hypothetical protein
MEHTLRSSYERAAAAEDAARRNHYEGETATESFWRKAAASLPPHAQRKYAHLFDAAERYEPVIDFIVDLFRKRRSGRTKVKGRVGQKAHA